MDYQHRSNQVSMINYHIVFCPKYRRHILVGKIKKRLDEIMEDVAQRNG
jgi:putative transposase